LTDLKIRRSLLIVITIVSPFLCAEHLSAQKRPKFPRKDSDLEKIRQERRETEQSLKLLERQMREYESSLKKISEKEKSSLAALTNLDHQLKLLNAIIIGLERTQTKLAREIEQTKIDLQAAEKDLAKMKDDFARYAVGIYKFGVRRDLELLFSASSVNQALMRAEYIKRFEDAGKLKLADISAKKNLVQSLKDTLTARYAETTPLLERRRAQADVYESRKAEREKTLAELRKNKKKFNDDIQKKQTAARLLQQEIQKLLVMEDRAALAERAKRADAQRKLEAEQRARAEKLTEKTAAEKQPPTLVERKDNLLTVDGGDGKTFDAYRGKLPWPVQGGVIVKSFGENRNKDLNIVTFNNGVDISVAKGTEVFSVAEGKVSQIAYLPTFGNVVIVRHANSFITVYANLTDIKVARGDAVAARQPIAVAAAASEGNAQVHFEVWKGKEKYNPELWLARN
jgi:septal ring factor EnvC (AmiA/AmiB activator)